MIYKPMETSISLGFNCLSAIKGVELGLRKRKADGYNTCPFDIGYTNYEGIILCLKEDFKHFCDLSYLKLAPIPFSNGHLEKDLMVIYNTRYNFIFNHESPFGKLYIEEGWSGGIIHFVDINFENFIVRYNNRIDYFRNYVKDCCKITFITTKNNNDNTELHETITDYYPHLKFEIENYMAEESEEEFVGYDRQMKYYSGNMN
jgi:hypothetical protein